MLVNGMLFSLVAGYLSHQIVLAGANFKPADQKASLDNRLKSLIPNHWLEGELEAATNATVDVVAGILKDDAKLKQLLVDLAGKDWLGTVAVMGALIGENFTPSTEEGQLVSTLAGEALAWVEGQVSGKPVQVAVVGGEAAVPGPSPLVTDEHVAEKTPA